jgi:hypothetical protein
MILIVIIIVTDYENDCLTVSEDNHVTCFYNEIMKTFAMVSIIVN